MRAILALAMLCAACATPSVAGGTQQHEAPLPAEVRAFVEKRDGCDHFRGEDPYDAERAKQIDAELTRLCTGTDAELARLRRVHARNKAVMQALAGYEDRVEP
jgi:cytochrome c556